VVEGVEALSAVLHGLPMLPSAVRLIRP
jgi:hypothetical protein